VVENFSYFILFVVYIFQYDSNIYLLGYWYKFIYLVLTLIGLSICFIVCMQAAGDLVSKDDAVMVFSKVSSAGNTS
jgi:hypothetical protein